jgi:hypothetical protein
MMQHYDNQRNIVAIIQPNKPKNHKKILQLANDPFSGYKFIMANLATKAPNFTVENAKAMSARAVEARRIKREREKELLALAEKLARSTAKPSDDESRKLRTLKQIDELDKRIDAALDDDDDDLFLKLCGAKERLWKLVQPTGGVAKPGRGRSQMPAAVVLSESENPEIR